MNLLNCIRSFFVGKIIILHARQRKAVRWTPLMFLHSLVSSVFQKKRSRSMPIIPLVSGTLNLSETILMILADKVKPSFERVRLSIDRSWFILAYFQWRREAILFAMNWRIKPCMCLTEMPRKIGLSGSIHWIASDMINNKNRPSNYRQNQDEGCSF